LIAIQTKYKLEEPQKNILCFAIVCGYNIDLRATLILPLLMAAGKSKCCEVILDKTNYVGLFVGLVFTLIYWLILVTLISTLLEKVYRRFFQNKIPARIDNFFIWLFSKVI
jgi:hypothetical protein